MVPHAKQDVEFLLSVSLHARPELKPQNISSRKEERPRQGGTEV
jgi:hypothetical protein